MRRTTYIFQSDNPDFSELYQSVLVALKDDIATFIPKKPSVKKIEGEWPNGSFLIDDFKATYREWQSLSVQPDYLFQVTLEFGKTYSPWKLDLNLASQTGDKLTFEEVWSSTTRRRKMPFENMPLLLNFLSEYTCKNEDGFLVGKIYLLDETRVYRFVEFLGSDDRQLPVLLFSPHPDLKKSDPHLRKEISARLAGSAHLVRLKDEAAASTLGDMLPAHSCKDGNIRVYWPGYSPDDKPESHRLWCPENETNLVTILLRLVAANTLQVNSENQEITLLKRKREQQYRKTKQDLSKSLKLLVASKQAVKDDAEWEELFELAELEVGERNVRIEAQEKELNDLRTENRTLRWRLTTAWQLPTTPELESVPENQLFLSTEARSIYVSLDEGERRYWERNILSKLLTNQLRIRQSEARNGYFVFPRKKTSDGRRLIYYLRDEQIYVCELFLSHDEYDRAHRQMKPADHYTGFETLAIAELFIRENVLDYQAEE